MKPHALRNTQCALALFVGALTPCHPASAAPRPHFTVIDLGTLPGGYYGVYPTKINDRGQVVGSILDPTGGTRRPFLYSDGVMVEIPVSPGSAYALGLNEAGMVVGSMSPSTSFLYNGGVVTDLYPFLGFSYVAASGINEAGQIVGWTGPTNGVFPAFLLSHDVVGFLQAPGASFSIAYDINNAGQAAGEIDFSFNGSPHAVIFEGGEVLDLGTLPGGTFSSGRAISENGLVTGWSGLNFQGPDVPNPSHAFLYRDGRMTDLGALPGDLVSGGRDVNSAGWVVGWSENSQEHQRAFLYIDSRMHDLNDLLKGHTEWRLGSAESVNERGQIVGWGIVRDEFRGFLLQPQHELATKPKTGQ